MGADSITIRLTDGPLAGEVVTAGIGSGTRYAVGGQQCVAPELSAGMTIAVLLVRGDHDGYSAREVGLFQD